MEGLFFQSNKIFNLNEALCDWSGLWVILPFFEGFDVDGLQIWMSDSGWGCRNDGKSVFLADVKLEKFVLEMFLFELFMFELFLFEMVLFDWFSMFKSVELAGCSIQFAGHDESRCFRCRRFERHSDSRSSDIWRRQPTMRHWQRQSQAEYGEQGEGLRIIIMGTIKTNFYFNIFRVFYNTEFDIHWEHN